MSIKTERAADLDDIREEIRTFQHASDSVSSRAKDLSLNIVISNLPENQNENIKNKVNALFRDGLRLSEIFVSDAERKQSHNTSKPGVVIAKMKSKDAKQLVMKEKIQGDFIQLFSRCSFIKIRSHLSEM